MQIRKNQDKKKLFIAITSSFFIALNALAQNSSDEEKKQDNDFHNSKSEFLENLEELKSVCYMAGVIAAQNYDASYEFSTYYKKVSKSEFIKYLAFKTRRLGTLPIGICARIPEITSAERLLTSEYQRTPTIEEEVKHFRKKDKNSNKGKPRISSEHLEWLRLKENPEKSVHSRRRKKFLPIGRGCKHLQLEVLIRKNPELIAIVNNGVLDSREKEIIKDRYGLEGRPPLTLKEVGKKHELTRERIRQIETSSIQKLQKNIYWDYTNPEESFL